MAMLLTGGEHDSHLGRVARQAPNSVLAHPKRRTHMGKKDVEGKGKNYDWLSRTASVSTIVRSIFALRDSNAFQRMLHWLFEPF